MSRSNAWKYIGVGLSGVVLGVVGLFVTVVIMLPHMVEAKKPTKVSLSDIGCPSGLREDLSASRCVITPENLTALAYATDGIDGIDLLKDRPEPALIRVAAAKVENDDHLAFNLYRMAAVLGDAHSQFILGSLYSRGVGVAENDLESLRWLHEAAYNGYRKAQLRLAYMLSKGEFVEKNEVEALAWLKRARDNQGVSADRAAAI